MCTLLISENFSMELDHRNQLNKIAHSLKDAWMFPHILKLKTMNRAVSRLGNAFTVLFFK